MEDNRVKEIKEYKERTNKILERIKFLREMK